MLIPRRCVERTASGEPCRQAPLVDGDRCYWHDPAHAEEAAQARKYGGQRRRRESTLQGAYDVGDLGTVAGIRRLLEVVVYDLLGMENSHSRARAIIAAAHELGTLLKVGELEEMLQELLTVVKPRIEADKQGAKRRR
jgi:hypothetical protein